MGVYINMEMPLFCDDCWMCQNSGGANEIGDDFCCLGGSPIDDPTIRPDWCPLVPIEEPHGRLIDADALCDRLERAAKTKPYLYSAFDTAISFALVAPTIISASKEDE